MNHARTFFFTSLFIFYCSLLGISALTAAPVQAQTTKTVAVASTKKAPAKTPPKKVVKRKSVSAIAGKDERKIFTNPVTRCLTPQMKTLNDQATQQMEKDIKALGQDHPNASQNYRSKLTIIWSAMSEPYCGYGSKGVTAVRGSFLKSVNKTRAAFLADVKKPDASVALEFSSPSAEGVSLANNSPLTSSDDLTPAQLTAMSPSTPLAK